MPPTIRPSRIIRTWTRCLPKRGFTLLLWSAVLLGCNVIAYSQTGHVLVKSPDHHHTIELNDAGANVSYLVKRGDRILIGPSVLGPNLADVGPLARGSRIVDVQRGQIDETFQLAWGKTNRVRHRCSSAVVTLSTARNLCWQIELRAYDDGVAFRYRLPQQDALNEFVIGGEATRFALADNPQLLFNQLDSFATSHESLYQRQPWDLVPTQKLFDCPLLVVWPDGMAAAITEARVREFAGMYLQKDPPGNFLQSRLSPLPDRRQACVVGQTPHESPWRVVLLSESAGKLIESNLLLCLNEPPDDDFSWAKPGKTTFHWWNGEFEDDFKLASEKKTFVQRHRRYIDFCARNRIAYHAVSGDGHAWYQHAGTQYGKPAANADVRLPRPELGLPEIIDYARQRGVGIRLWVHWRPLSRHLEEAMALYASWGVTGLMVDFLDRDDQEMIEFTERMLKCAARHRIHLQIHGSPKFSGEQRTFPHLFNREGVLNLEYCKWSSACTPQHDVNVAYTRALSGPVDYHLGGFRSISRTEFKPRDRAPMVMGTRCHHLALYVVYENPMPMVADRPNAYEGQIGFEFIKTVPTTWDETRFVAGKVGEFIVVARRQGSVWYLAGITNWKARTVSLPLSFLATGNYRAKCWVDGSTDESKPNLVRVRQETVNLESTLQLTMAAGGGFVAIIEPKPAAAAK